MTERETMLALAAKAEDNARCLEQMGKSLLAMGDVDILVSLDEIRADIAAIEVYTPTFTYALRG
jgi:hypothetical protein